MNPRTLTDEELIQATRMDAGATEREVVLAKRLAQARDYIDEIEAFLLENDLAEKIVVSLQ